MSNSTRPPSPSSSSALDMRKVGSYIFIVVLAVVFMVAWGPGSQGCERGGRLGEQAVPVAVVNGKEISTARFMSAYRAQVANYKAQGVPVELIRQFGLHKQFVERMVEGELMVQAAEAKGLKPSDEEILKELKKTPAFQNKDGAFDFQTYQRVVRDHLGRTEPEYEAELRRELGAQRLRDMVRASVAVSDDEVRARYDREGNAAKATFVRLAATAFASKVAAPKPAELQAWANGKDAAVAEFYEQNKMTWNVPEKAHLRQVLLRVDREADPARKEEVRAKLEKIRKEIVDDKKPFAELAAQHSEDPETKSKGGDLGFVDRLALPGRLADVAFALKPQEVSAVVETPLGFHLATLEELRPAEQRPLEAVRGEVVEQLYRRTKAKELAKTEAERALAAVKKGKKLKELYPAPEKPSEGFSPTDAVQAQETGEFNSGVESIPVLGVAPEVAKAIFARSEPGLIDAVLAVQEAFVVVVVDERRTTSDADFGARRDTLRVEALKGKQMEVEGAFVKSLRQTSQVRVNDGVVDQVLGSDAEG